MLSRAQLDFFHGDLQHGIRGCTEKNKKKKILATKEVELDTVRGETVVSSVAPLPFPRGQERQKMGK